MLGPARTTRAYRIVRLSVVVLVALFMVGLGAAQYTLISLVQPASRYESVVTIGISCVTVICGWLAIIPFATAFRPYRWVRWTILALFTLGAGVGLFHQT